MGSSMMKTTLREIRQSLGRYLAIMAIVALGVGLFCGLKVTRDVMVKVRSSTLRSVSCMTSACFPPSALTPTLPNSFPDGKRCWMHREPFPPMPSCWMRRAKNLH